MIYVIGDSHVEAFDDSFTKINPSALTAYQNINKIESIEGKLAQFNIDKDIDILIFSFGEVDIRCHLGFIADNNNRTYEDVIDECLTRYGMFLDHFIKCGFRIGVWGVIPSGPYDDINGNGRPSYKTYTERNELTAIFNKKLEFLCTQKRIIYKSIFDIIVNDMENYSLYYSTNVVHLNAGKFKMYNNEKDCEKLIRNEFEEFLPGKP